jgi:hypothetical protein
MQLVWTTQGLVGIKFFKNGEWIEVAIDTVCMQTALKQTSCHCFLRMPEH